MNDHIEVYENAFDTVLCTRIIEKFASSREASPGLTGSGEIDAERKHSLDLTITNHPDWNPLLKQIMVQVSQQLVKYVRKYGFILFGRIGQTIHDPSTGQMVVLDQKNMRTLPTEVIASLISSSFRPAQVNVQKYERGVGGYHKWHSEIAPADPAHEILHRVLFYIVYLNDVRKGGETSFYYQKRKVQPKAGRMVIAPGGFTHTHKGEIPKNDDKYILTSWVLFNRIDAC